MTISCSHLSFSFPQTSVLENATFEIKNNEFVGIIGPNGGGKTTLLQLLMGFLKPTHGKILIDDRSPKEKRREMGYVPQNFQFDRQFPISTLEVVLAGRLAFSPLFGSYRYEDNLLAHQMLEKVGLKKQIHTPFSSLSSGQMQRALIARALVSNPHFLFLDEAISNIDRASQKEIFELLLELKNQMTILMVTHDLNLAIQSVDRMLLVEGKVTPLTLDEVCKHFAIGLYHPPLKNLKREKS